jgi:hypothetical protein
MLESHLLSNIIKITSNKDELSNYNQEKKQKHMKTSIKNTRIISIDIGRKI